MRVLWLCNIMLPMIAKSLKLNASVKEGWLSGIAKRLMDDGGDNGAKVGICFPMSDMHLREVSERSEALGIKPLNERVIKGEVKTLSYYGFLEGAFPENYDAGLEKTLKTVLEDFKPDIVHCFGTEYPHTLAMARAFNDPQRLLIGIQGLMYVYTDNYRADLPEDVWNKKTLRDIIRKDSLTEQREKYKKRGEHEKEAIRLCGNITGRTDWDLENTRSINPTALYHFMNETLRSSFYGKTWDEKGAEKHSIFLSQANYPIKGLHYLLWAMPELLKKYPDIKIIAAGDIITGDIKLRPGMASIKKYLKLSAYGSYIRGLIKRLGLSDKIEFTGPLGEEDMLKMYLKSHLFLCPSSIENSPNSVGEAMLLSMSVVSADVGGVSSMMTDNKEGILYPHNDTKALIKAIDYMFDDKNKEHVQSMRKAAGKRALSTHDPDTNFKRLMEIYNDIMTMKKS